MSGAGLLGKGKMACFAQRRPIFGRIFFRWKKFKALVVQGRARLTGFLYDMLLEKVCLAARRVLGSSNKTFENDVLLIGNKLLWEYSIHSNVDAL